MVIHHIISLMKETEIVSEKLEFFTGLMKLVD
jgi:hypothetical protein